MACILAWVSPLPTFPRRKHPHFKLPYSTIHFTPVPTCYPKSIQQSRPFSHRKISITAPLPDETIETIELNESLCGSDAQPFKYLILVLIWASVSIGLYAFSKDAKAAADSVRTSSFGVKIANTLRASSWPDECIVFTLATLPVIELRGAIPVGYWLQMKPLKLTLLSIAGNMVPVPLIILFLKKLAAFLSQKSEAASRLLNMLFKRAKQKAGPVEEFQWLGLMLFVAVPFPGTGAWTGAIIASVLDMPFWDGVSANFAGVVVAGLLVNLLVNLGLRYAVLAGGCLFVFSTFMWSILRGLRAKG